MKTSRNINFDTKRSCLKNKQNIASTFTNSQNGYFPKVKKPQFNMEMSFKSVNSTVMGKFQESDPISRPEFKTTVYSELASSHKKNYDLNSVHSWSQSENTDDINRKIASVYKQKKEFKSIPRKQVSYLKQVSTFENILKPKRDRKEN